MAISIIQTPPSLLPAYNPIYTKVSSTKTAEDKYIMPIIGSPLYESLIDKINAGTVTGDSKNLLDNYIAPTLIEYSLLEYIPFTSFKFKNTGVQKQTTPDSISAEIADLNYLKENVRESAQFYAEKLIRHLKANINKYPEYYKYVSIEDTRPARGDYFNGIQFPGMNRGDCGLDGLGYTINIDF